MPPLVADASGNDRARLEQVADKLVTKNAELCPRGIGTLARPATKNTSARTQCKITFRLVPRDGVGVAADENEILITTGMLGFARDDDELAAVLAHRMAHRLAEAPAPQPFLTQLRDDFGLGPGRAPEPVYDAAQERTADRISLFLLARADFDPARAVQFWRRLTSLPPDANDWVIRHPPSPQRIEAMEGIVTEIGVLRSTRQALKP